MRSRLPVVVLTCLVAVCVAFGQGPAVGAQRALVVEASTGKVLWSRDADTPAFPASTTKIMTALLLVERCRPDEIITAPADTEEVKESSMHLLPGEKIRASHLLAALMLRSANDGAHAVAVHLAGSDAAFAKMMNARARELGCKNTSFNNPHGLNDEAHTTSAHDLALIAREAMRHERFREVAALRRTTIERSANQEDRIMVSRNRWLAKDPTADGIKTGYTAPAGHCYVGSATRDGYRVITVILNSPDWQEDHRQMLDWAFAAHSRTHLADPGQPVLSARVEGGRSESVAATVVSPVIGIVRRGASAHPTIRIEREGPVAAPIAKGQSLGFAEFVDSEGFAQRVELVAAAAVGRAPLLVRAAAGIWTASPWLAVGGLGVFAWRRTRRPKRRRRLVRNTSAQ